MSVINKMLRDLDQRASMPTAATSGHGRNAGLAPLAGTSSLADAGRGTPQRRWPSTGLLVCAAALLALLAAGAWLWQRAPGLSAQPAAAQARPPAAATPLAAAPRAPQTTGAAPSPPAEAPSASASASAAVRAPATVPVPVTALVPALKIAAAPAAPAAPATAAQGGATVGVRSVASAAEPVAATPSTRLAPAVVTPATPVASELQGSAARQLQAGRDALAQAQAQWAAGAHDGATELLQGAIASMERAGVSAPSAAQTQLLAALARELGRMQLAEGRAAAALETLARLEPQLGREADIWAMRGNATQRLGRHQDSVQAYATALQLRPNEQRWMLGSAVSLAALGQTANASEMADKARALGPISKEVQAYLRQAGVRLTEP